MPHSLRAKLSGLRYKGILEDKDYKRLCKALEATDVLDKIRAEIEQDAFKDVNGSKYIFVNRVNQIIDKYRGEVSE